ncbi:hypothetical protein SCE1572_39150 [Sorangium cellulosum So0157-2]|uniref:Luciferase-like domain-containing protein n=1 Tax=Sorangium cellulosum So0157-2 TaxID=1254432 RepID=S4Y6C7_SORCE|nr:hypothetical protein SCE1572_39150 [Sorangium cellulosum So0157-2]
MADHLAVLNMPLNALMRSHTVTSFEPFTLLSALAGATERIGLVATASTTFDQPYPKHLRDNLQFARKGPLPADVLAEAKRRLSEAGSVPEPVPAADARSRGAAQASAGGAL